MILKRNYKRLSINEPISIKIKAANVLLIRNAIEG